MDSQIRTTGDYEGIYICPITPEKNNSKLAPLRSIFTGYSFNQHIMNRGSGVNGFASGINRSINQIYTGKEFNQKYKDKVLVKLTNEKECHNGFKFETGFNKDMMPFTSYGNCLPGGIYFCEFDDIHRWINYNNKFMVNLRVVTIPNSARVYEMRNKFKADKLILGPALNIWVDYDLCYLMVCQNPKLIDYVPHELRTSELLKCYEEHMSNSPMCLHDRDDHMKKILYPNHFSNSLCDIN